MGTIRLILIISSPIFGIISYLTLSYYNSGQGGSLNSKRGYLKIGILTILLSIISLILYFINPIFLYDIFNSQIINKLGTLNWIEIIVTAIVGAPISKVIELIFFKKRDTKS